MKSRIQNAVLRILFICVSASVSAENIRGPIAGSIELTQGKSSSEIIQTGLEELVSINPGKDLRFYKALEIAVNLPRALLEYGDSFAIFVYGPVTPIPVSDKVPTFRGTRLLLAQFRFRQKLYIQLPFRNQQKRESSPDTEIFGGVTDSATYPVLVTILPILKGVPSSLSETKFQISARLVPSGEGSLAVRVTDENGKKIDKAVVMMGAKTIQDPAGEQILKPGIYTLEVSAQGYKSERKSVSVEEARQTVATFQLVQATTTVLIEAPRDAVIYLDGERIVNFADNPIPVQDGEHTVILKLGDYQVTRNFKVSPGKTYKISVLLDFLIQEN